MAITSYGKSLRQSAFSLHLRSSVVKSHRGFAVTATRNGSVAEAFVSIPSAVLGAVHATSIPWYAAIPITGIVVRGVFCYYICDRPSRFAGIKRQVVAPLSFAKQRGGTEKEVRSRQKRSRSSDIAETARRISTWKYLQQMFRSMRTMHTLGKSIGAPLFHPRSLFNLVTFLSFMEAIRYKCGLNSGFIRILAEPLQWAWNWTKGVFTGDRVISASADTSSGSSSSNEPVVASSPDELLAERLEAIITSKQGATPYDSEALLHELHGNKPINDSIPHLPPIDSTASHMIDTTLQNEGLTWCTDLTVPDPYHVLPLTLALSMSANVLLTYRRPWDSPIVLAGPNSSLTFFQRVRLSFNWIIFFGAMHLPAGLLLYWISHTITGWLMTRWLDVKYPLPRPIVPCKKPLRRSVDTQWQRV